ncbi:hypothetical protein [Azohydromonas aeria]|uniref:hypothetical protein n=1 Tax=Azohydromonas aeria TaxID=2590212 RepID=UPI0012F84269|nr:hypothetical protein [Azohydromonas aeria]
MLLALQNAITQLLKSALPDLFTGADAVQLGFGSAAWTLDAMSADPVAGEPGPQAAQDRLPFDPAAPAGPHALTRTPYPGPRRVRLRSAAGDLAVLAPEEVAWSADDAAAFTLQPRASRALAGFDQVQVDYDVLAAGTQLKAQHQATLSFGAADAQRAEAAAVLALAVLVLQREALRAQGGFDFDGGGYQARGVVQSLHFSGGGSGAGPAAARTLQLAAEIDLRVQRLLGDDEGRPITQILSPGRGAPGRRVDIDPVVDA